jgi:hypothetical protein
VARPRKHAPTHRERGHNACRRRSAASCRLPPGVSLANVTRIGGSTPAAAQAFDAQTTQTSQATRENVPKIEGVRVKPIDPAAQSLGL